jgi:Tat protein translocase TatB subunit
VLLFILESIGTSELILIGISALIFLGPRKLPQIARTIGKTMADFRSTTNEFKSTWEREVNFEEEAEALRSGDLPSAEPAPIPRESTTDNSSKALAMPEIKPAQPSMFEEIESAHVGQSISEEAEGDHDKSEDVKSMAEDVSDKKNWL